MNSVSATFNNLYNYIGANINTYLTQLGAANISSRNWHLGWKDIVGGADFPGGFLALHEGKPDQISKYEMQDRPRFELWWALTDKTSPNLAASLFVDAVKQLVLADQTLGGNCLWAELGVYQIATDDYNSSVAIVKFEIDTLIQ